MAATLVASAVVCGSVMAEAISINNAINLKKSDGSNLPVYLYYCSYNDGYDGDTKNNVIFAPNQSQTFNFSMDNWTLGCSATDSSGNKYYGYVYINKGQIDTNKWQGPGHCSFTMSPGGLYGNHAIQCQ